MQHGNIDGLALSHAYVLRRCAYHAFGFPAPQPAVDLMQLSAIVLKPAKGFVACLYVCDDILIFSYTSFIRVKYLKNTKGAKSKILINPNELI